MGVVGVVVGVVVVIVFVGVVFAVVPVVVGVRCCAHSASARVRRFSTPWFSVLRSPVSTLAGS